MSLASFKQLVNKNLRQKSVQGWGDPDDTDYADTFDALADEMENISTGGGNITLPIAATSVTPDATHRFTTDTDIAKLAALVAPVDYSIEKIGSTIYARPTRAGLTLYSGTDAYTVIQAAITALTPSGGGIGSAGGKIHIKGNHILTNELQVVGWEGTASGQSYSQLIIEGEGKFTKLYQNTAGKNGLVIKNNAGVVLLNLYIECNAGARSALRLDSSGANSEISAFGCVFDNLMLISNSSSYPALYMQNFFDINVGMITAINVNYDAIIIENASTTILYGNSNFGFVRAIASTAPSFAGLRIRSTDGANYHAINLMTFQNFQCVAGYYGVFISDGSNITFGMVDIEYGTIGFHIGGGTYARHNYILSGLISVLATNGKCIECSLGGNTFHCQLGGATTAIPISDTQQFEPPNHYDVILTNNNSANIAITSAARTFLRYRDPGTGRTFTNLGDNVTVTTQTAGNSSAAPATTAFVATAVANALAAAGKQILGSNVALANTGSTTKNIIYTGNIPASSIGINGSFHFILLLSATNNGNAKTVTLEIGGVSIANITLTSQAFGKYFVTLHNRNNASAQITGNNGSQAQLGWGTSTIPASAFSFNTAGALVLTITAQNGVGTDTITLEAFQLIGYN